MAAAAKVRASPPPPPARRTVAWLACTHLAMATFDAVFCLFLASMWILFWGLATSEIGRLACGEGCAVVAASYTVASVAAGAILVLVLPFVAQLLLALMIARTKKKKKAAAATDIEAAKEHAPKTSGAAMRDDVLCDPVLLGFLALMVFTLLKLIGVLVKADSPVMGSRQERMGSMIYDVGAIGKTALECFFLCPVATVWIWRSWRKARRALRCGMQLRKL